MTDAERLADIKLFHKDGCGWGYRCDTAFLLDRIQELETALAQSQELVLQREAQIEGLEAEMAQAQERERGLVSLLERSDEQIRYAHHLTDHVVHKTTLWTLHVAIKQILAAGPETGE